MSNLEDLFKSNASWAEKMAEEDPELFNRLAAAQTPEYLWIGCSDSRVPVNQLAGVKPGHIFTHRNIANLVYNTDVNFMSVFQYALETLKVKHIVICGHYGCGGVKAAVQKKASGTLNQWLTGIDCLHKEYKDEISSISTENARLNLMCELNALKQAHNLCQIKLMKQTWADGQDVSVHCLIYNLADGKLMDLGFQVTSNSELDSKFNQSIKTAFNRYL